MTHPYRAPPNCGACHRLRVPTAQDPLRQGFTHVWIRRPQKLASKCGIDPVRSATRQLTLGQGQQLQRLHAAGQRIGHGGQGHQVGRPRQQKPPRAAVLVHTFLDRQQQLRRALDFIDHCAIQPTNQARRIFPGRQKRYLIVQRQIAHPFLRHLPDQRRLARLARPRQQHHGRVEQSFPQACRQLAVIQRWHVHAGMLP
ncbi:hypothetical protein D9M68_712700 [compost metagenome]